MVFHIVLLLVLAIITLDGPEQLVKQEITIGTSEDIPELEEFEIQDISEPVDVEVTETADTPVVSTMTDAVTEPIEVAVANDIDTAAISVELSDFGETTAPKSDLLATAGALSGTGLSGRGQAARAANVKAGGGTPGSEEAVALALEWLSKQQQRDGSWDFAVLNQCPNAGSLRGANNGATGMALLPFLGAGQTHLEGKYKETVGRGLYYLGQHQDQKGGWFESGGSMYSHGICAIAMCEAYAMTQDRGLMNSAQGGINFIVYAQDPVGGGWRYAVKQAGDTSAVGWQLMALKSGHMAYLNVPPNTVKGAAHFLDSVQSDSGAKYGYATPGAGQGTTAVGLLSRMYLGWKKDEPALQRGVQYLSGIGPSKGNMYYNYYATQIMRHNEGDEWKKWNDVMRDQLVTTQSKVGPMKGSWHMEGGGHGGERGGRLYNTALATMILEVYYRHMPIYRKQAAEEDFPL